METGTPRSQILNFSNTFIYVIESDIPFEFVVLWSVILNFNNNSFMLLNLTIHLNLLYYVILLIYCKVLIKIDYKLH